MPRLEGAYSTVVMTKSGICAFRDPSGVRPLALGRLGSDFLVASESCAFDIVGAELVREVNPGEMVSLSERGLEVRQAVKPKQHVVLRLRAHLLLAPRHAGSRAGFCSRSAAGWARSSGARRRSTPTS